jgi:hypothetical protein
MEFVTGFNGDKKWLAAKGLEPAPVSKPAAPAAYFGDTWDLVDGNLWHWVPRVP